jgi:hypothetical protein
MLVFTKHCTVVGTLVGIIVGALVINSTGAAVGAMVGLFDIGDVVGCTDAVCDG